MMLMYVSDASNLGTNGEILPVFSAFPGSSLSSSTEAVKSEYFAFTVVLFSFSSSISPFLINVQTEF